MDFKTYANLDEMMLMAGGNPHKMAQYATARRELDALKAKYFNEQFPFVDGFSESHLEKLKAFAEENPDDHPALIRYELQKARFAAQEAKKTAHLDIRQAKSSLRQKLEAGNVTARDLDEAAALVRRNGSDDNRVLYAAIKSKINEGGQE
jgi:hypothetical protein